MDGTNGVKESTRVTRPALAPATWSSSRVCRHLIPRPEKFSSTRLSNRELWMPPQRDQHRVFSHRRHIERSARYYESSRRILSL